MQKLEKPQGGLGGLKYWRYDLPAGLQVALLWLPFSLGVALASGAPAIAGLISAIVAGLLYPFLGGSHVTVSGPAAALAPVLLWGMLLLGNGDLATGYPLVLVAIVLTGVLQLVLSFVRAGQYASMLPATVVEAMLASIGIMIILRQIPALVGAPAIPSQSVLASLANLPQQLGQAQLLVAAVGLASLALMFALRKKKSGWWRWLPAAIVVAGFGILAGLVVDFDAALRISMPESVKDGFHLPAFAVIITSPDLWLTMALVVFTFTMIDGVESVASVKAVDKIDPWHRKSDANKTLRAMGVCNLTSGMIGGLTVIPNAVPSRANIDAGARTLWSNLYSGLFLLLFVLVLPDLLIRIPLAAIAAILIYIGWRLCEPALFVRMLSIGFDRFVVFVGTVVAILLTDLLLGMLIGVAIELSLLLYLLMPSLRYVLTGRLDPRAALTLLWTNFSGLFKSPVIKHRSEVREGQTWHVLTMGSLVGFNLLQLEKQLARLPETEGVLLRFTESARIIDHTAVEFLQHIEEEAAAAGRCFVIEGTDNFQTFSVHPLASRMQEAQFAKKRAELDERAQRLAALAVRLGLEFAPATKATINRNDFVYLQRGDQREECNVIAGPWAGGHIRLFDYSHASAPDYHLAHRHTLMIFSWPAAVNSPDFVITPGHYLERYLTHLSEIAAADVPGLPVGYRLYSVAGADLREALPERLLNGLATLGPLYFELRGGIAVVFRPQCALEGEAEIEKFAAWATHLIDTRN
ncbi:MAG: SulP family inorganic anion transporter [Rhodocyclaceae bacterium]|nr:SulP family inorganic anion transporter [Rhodocyclaceae bacterium]MDZ4214043.1 SulP family inorganic anion transporter [Rhodocyclaceae bacterium]